MDDCLASGARSQTLITAAGEARVHTLTHQAARP
jgi:hypothetical protein